MLAGPDDGDYGRFQPGAGISLGFDDLKVIECAGLLRAVADGSDDDGATIEDGVAASRLMAALREASPPTWSRI
jgi:hypothetical protein